MQYFIYRIGNQLTKRLFNKYVRNELIKKNMDIIICVVNKYQDFLVLVNIAQHKLEHPEIALDQARYLDERINCVLIKAAIKSLVRQRPQSMGYSGKDDTKKLIYSKFVPQDDCTTSNSLPRHIEKGSFERKYSSPSKEFLSDFILRLGGKPYDH